MQSRHGQRRVPPAGSATACPNGFTLIELMVTVAVVAILAVVAMPNLLSVINNNRLASQTNELITSLQMARSEAVRLNTPVTVCRSTNGTSCAAAGSWDRWITLAGAQVLRDTSARPPVQITSGVAAITYRSDGLARDATGALLVNTITVCVPTGQPLQNQRLMNMTAGGRIETVPASGAGACP